MKLKLTFVRLQGLCLVFLPLFLSLTVAEANNTIASIRRVDAFANAAQDESATELTAQFKNGQVFLTWQKVSDGSAYYKVYRSTSPITSGSQLASCEYLGWTNSTSSIDQDLTHHDKMDVYLVIDSGAAPLTPETGLFVATTLTDGKYYYAVTTLIDDVEDMTIIPGVNSLQQSISEVVEEPTPVFQQTKIIEDRSVAIYTTFVSMKYATGQPLMNKAGFLSNDFALYTGGGVGAHRPLQIRFHGGGADFLYNILSVSDSEINLNPEHIFPSGDNASWWGANENFDLYDGTKNVDPPASGINYNFMYTRVTRIIDWALKHLPVDSSRIYLDGSSLGCIGAFYYALTFPDRIAAVKLSGSVFNLGFQSDFNPLCTLNPGKSNRVSGNEQFGTVTSDLQTNLGNPTYQVLNGCWVTGAFNEKNFPVVYSINGKNDTIVGWTEKTIYYDSVNAHHIGGYYFWDGRNHGNNTGSTWGDDNFNIFKYRSNVSFPAFANCSANEDPGDGHATSGAPFGSINGFLDWKDAIVDDSAFWQATLFLRNLIKADGSIYSPPSSCSVDVTLRRLQQFHVTEGDTLWWTVKHIGQVIQSGQQVYHGGIITIPQVMVFTDSVQLEVTVDSANLTGSVDDAFVTVYPNPFTEATNIRWQMSESGMCSVKVYDVQGRLVKTLVDTNLSEGIYQVSWNGDDQNKRPLFTGIYFLRIETETGSATKELALMK